MSRRPSFGYIYIPDFTGEERLVRISDLDIGDIENQARYGENQARYGQDEKECYIRTDNGFCQTSWTSGITAMEVLEKIAKHDKDNLGAFRDYAHRNRIVLMKGELW